MTPTQPPRDEEAERAFGRWWFINGGGIHGLWKRREYLVIRGLAMKLPEFAFKAGVDWARKNPVKKEGE